jgi:hypothetical protein
MKSGGDSAKSLGNGSQSWTPSTLIAASVVWMIAAGYAGVHLPVGPAISNYEVCLRHSDPAICRQTLHQEWSKHSGDRLYYGGLLAFSPLPLFWGIAYGFRRRKASPTLSP